VRVIDKTALQKARDAGRCDICGQQRAALDAHHILCRGAGGGSRLDIPQNLLALCHEPCHRFCQERLPRRVQLQIVIWRDGLDRTPEQLEEELWQILRTKK